MSAQEEAVAVPPVEDVVCELVATLMFAAHAYLIPPDDSAQPDLDAASIAIDVAGAAFERIGPRLKSERQTALSGLLTDIRMTYVRKRGQ